MASGGFSFGRHRGRLLAILASLVAACSGVAAAGAAGASGNVGLARISAAPLAPAKAKRIGAVEASSILAGTVVLRPRDNVALQRFIGEVSDPGSPIFRHYLAPGAFGGRFGPTAATIDAVEKQLSSAGLSVTSVSSDGLLVRFRGTATRIERAFHTGLQRYQLTNGSAGHIMTSAPMLPATIARSVAAVVGLNTLVHLQPLDVVRPPRSTWGTRRKASAASFPHPHGAPKACHAASAAAKSFGGLTDDEIAHAYGAFGLFGAGDLAAGQHIALYELEPFLRSDIKVFDTCYFGASDAAKKLARLHVIPVDGGQPAGTGSGEALLDVEDLQAMAPGASVDVYEGPSPSADGVEYDPVDEYAAIIDNDRDRVISTSWGLCEQSIQDGQPGLQEAENLLFEQAAAQGQTIFAAAGDNGSDDCGPETVTLAAGQNPVSVDDPGSQPYVVSVGGTSIDDAASQPPVEQVWNDGGSGGAGGGGISESWTMPAWQRQAAVPGIPKPGSADYKNAASVEREHHFPTRFCQSNVAGGTSSTPCRVVPDVSSQADEFTGAITVYQAAFGGWGPTGGTSSATPIWAAMLADVNASPACASHTATRNGVGFANPLLYAVASVPGEYPASFNDVTKGNNDVYGLDSGLVFPATSGYDLASGLGSPRLSGPGDSAGLAYYMCTLGASSSRPAVTRLSPASGSIRGGKTITISGRGFESGGKSDVAYIEVGNAQLGPAHFRVRSDSAISATLPPAKATRPPDAPAPQNGAGPAQVIVVLRNGATSAPSERSRFEYVDARHGHSVPGITGVIPVGGAETAPGTATILGSGFTGASRVTFGGVPATRYKVDGPNRITATPPPYSHRTACSPLPKTGVYAGENATNDICQVQVRVANASGKSATGHIRPPLEGAITLNPLGDLVAPPHCGCEIAPAPTEYDYLPAPKVTSVSTSSGGPRNLASESKGTLITVHGAGLGPLTVEWADFGNPALGSSMDTNFVYETGTEVQIVAPRHARTVEPVKVPFSVKTLAGQSASRPVTYAGVPTVTRVINETRSKRLHGIAGVADTGRTPLKIDGKGFAGQLIAPMRFVGKAKGTLLSTQYKFAINGNDKISTQSVAQVPALDEVELCTVSGCSHHPPGDELYAYAPGNPSVTSVSPRSGPAAGGTKVTIGGDNLGCAIGVFFGNTAAKSFSRVSAALYCGETKAVDATSPPGPAGKRVPVTVETVESYFTGTGRGKTSARFTYK